MTTIIRRKVSQNRRRHKDGKYDLDLTYISHNIIAMGYPSDKIMQGLIRNPIEVVSKFLKEKHPSTFKIFNLCIETDYDFSHFNNMVEHFPLEDHNPPTFQLIQNFCENVDKWLTKNDNNIAVVHCKAGKGRTGTMIACYYLYSSKFVSPFEAMEEFNCKRCKDNKGICIPSQRRYVEYYADFILNKRVYQKIDLNLNFIRVEFNTKQNNTCQNVNNYQISVLRLEIYEHGAKKIFESKKFIEKDDNMFIFLFNKPILLFGDIKFCFLTRKRNCLFNVIFNTFCFIQENKYSLEKNSCQGKKKANDDGTCEWSVKKKDIDLAFKDGNFTDDLNITFNIQFKDRNQSPRELSKKNIKFELTNNQDLISNTTVNNIPINNLNKNIDKKSQNIEKKSQRILFDLKENTNSTNTCLNAINSFKRTNSMPSTCIYEKSCNLIKRRNFSLDDLSRVVVTNNFKAQLTKDIAKMKNKSAYKNKANLFKCLFKFRK